MVLAAGFGTRLKPLTDSLPKCLVEVGGMPLLELALRQLAKAGVSEAVVNAHHHADQVAAWLNGPGAALGLRLALSREDPVLDTGGGLKNAAWFFDDGRPFLVFNADVVTDLDLRALMDRHRDSGALITLAVRDRPSQRPLLFADGRLVGRADPAARGGEVLVYSGVHACGPELFARMTEQGAFPLAEVWLRLAAEGALIAPFRHDGGFWVDIGNPEKLARARELVAERGLPL